MKLKYNFEIMEMDDQFVAVPVGDNADEFRGIIKLNESAEVIFDKLTDNVTKDMLVEELMCTYDISIEEANKCVDYILDILRHEGVLEFK